MAEERFNKMERRIKDTCCILSCFLLFLASACSSGSPTASLANLRGCEDFKSDELLEMERLVKKDGEFAIDEVFSKYARTTDPEEAVLLYGRVECMDAILINRSS